jgi:hypothetical protein
METAMDCVDDTALTSVYAVANWGRDVLPFAGTVPTNPSRLAVARYEPKGTFAKTASPLASVTSVTGEKETGCAWTVVPPAATVVSVTRAPAKGVCVSATVTRTRTVPVS